MKLEKILNKISKAKESGSNRVEINKCLDSNLIKEIESLGYEVIHQSSFCIQYENIYYTIVWN
jgi:hypothetical protein